MDRRSFLRTALAGAGTIAFGEAFWRAAQAGPAGNADASTYGALGPADANGLQYPSGFSGRVIARSGTPIGPTGHVWPAFPDGAACFLQDDGGWILVVNSENPPPGDVGLLPQLQDQLGGASAIRFDASGNIVDAYWILRGTRSNCSGGVTPWGSWLSCEEFDFTVRTPGSPTSDAGRVFECHPTDKGMLLVNEVPTLGRFKHEAAAFDDRGRAYLTEDLGDGCLYRFTPPEETAGTAASLAAGTLEALKVDNGVDGAVSWVPVPDPGASAVSTRVQAAANGATPFNGGEGCFYNNGAVLFTTKGDDRVWSLALGSGSDPDILEVLYDGAADGDAGVLSGVDNIIVSPCTGNIYVAEDGGNMEVVVIETSGGEDDLTRTAAPLIRATGPQHGQSNPSPVPTASEITGLALSPDCRRLYFNGQRTFGIGVTYEVAKPNGKPF